MNESLVKYLAGLLDADGSLSFSFKADQNKEGRCFVGLTLRLASSNAVDSGGWVETLPTLTGMGTVSRHGAKGQFVTWGISRRADLEMILPRLVKHMAIKAQHWQWMLETWRTLRAGDKTVSVVEREALTAASKESRVARVGPLKPKNHPTWAWLSGYLDGDGWYSYRRNYDRTRGYWQWQVHVGAAAHANDASVLEFLQTAFGGTVADHNSCGSVKVWRRSLGYQNRAFALRLLPNLAKHSRLKRHKIDAIIHHHRQRLSVPGTDRTFCSVEQCEAPAHGQGLCSKHYQQYRRGLCKRQSEAPLAS